MLRAIVANDDQLVTAHDIAMAAAILDTVIADHARIPIGDITWPLIRDWVSDLSVDMAPASVHKAIGVIRQVLAMAIAQNRLVD